MVSPSKILNDPGQKSPKHQINDINESNLMFDQDYKQICPGWQQIFVRF